MTGSSELDAPTDFAHGVLDIRYWVRPMKHPHFKHSFAYELLNQSVAPFHCIFLTKERHDPLWKKNILISAALVSLSQ